MARVFSLSPFLRAATSFARAERVGVRGLFPQKRWQLDSRRLPLTRIASAMQSGLSPQAGRGKDLSSSFPARA
ncbi:hypothetical protein BJA5080_01907 [Bradyrhizobium diazoefficiens SEMIA 5080]|uniref:Uncharacterized protein n=1 Tax=Bradyrhizobium diazoefficiens SEMIA 5080 TaxID=754504 RepID=A0A837C7W2_9BRAD|nr:hypothetical protein BJA5080_01907 [Bradyrhizobium diazoefficiens SEMIA 5080]